MPSERMNDLKKAFKEFYSSLDKQRIELLSNEMLIMEARLESLRIIDMLEEQVIAIENICIERGRY